MTIQEAIEVVNTEMQCIMNASDNECNRECAGCSLVMTDKAILTAYDMAIKALESMPEYEKLKEKDRAKKPKGISINEEHMRVGNCPNCNKFLTDRYDKHHCECGQRIDWSEE